MDADPPAQGSNLHAETHVGTQDQIYSRRGLINRTTFTAAEIGDRIVSVLERRLAAMRAELQKLRAE